MYQWSAPIAVTISFKVKGLVGNWNLLTSETASAFLTPRRGVVEAVALAVVLDEAVLLTLMMYFIVVDLKRKANRIGQSSQSILITILSSCQV
jgi:hypothetical protein